MSDYIEITETRTIIEISEESAIIEVHDTINIYCEGSVPATPLDCGEFFTATP